jgi:hypothetical protein
MCSDTIMEAKETAPRGTDELKGFTAVRITKCDSAAFRDQRALSQSGKCVRRTKHK